MLKLVHYQASVVLLVLFKAFGDIHVHVFDFMNMAHIVLVSVGHSTNLYTFPPPFSALKSTLVELLSPRQPLKPIRRERRKPKPQNVHVTSANIVVRVVRAFNVPTRNTAHALTG